MTSGDNTGGLITKARDQLGTDVRDLMTALGERAVQVVSEQLTGATGRLTEYARQGVGPGLVAAATGAQRLGEGDSPMKAFLRAGMAGGKEKLMTAIGVKGGKGGGGDKLKVTNIVEAIEVGMPVRVAYNQWTQFGDFPSFMKKVETADTESDEKLTWKAQILWSHRTWESTVVRQIPDKLIHWRSKGEKGAVDGTVSFHELSPDLTRILVVLEYHPQGLFERTGNIWRAQGRRVRLELKHFVRHVMTQTALDPDSVTGWRGEIEDSRVVRDHDTALREEQEQRGKQDEHEAHEERRRSARRRPGRREPVEEEYEDAYDEDEEGYDEEEPEEEPPPRRRTPERARRPRPAEQSRPRRAAGTSRRPVVRRRPEDDQ